MDQLNILITGVNGFVGSFLAAELVKKGHTVIGVGRRDECSIRGIKYVKWDVLDENFDENILSTLFEGVDVVVHLAALTTHDEIVNNKNKALIMNFLGTKNVLDRFNKSTSTKKFIYSSTGKVYGKSYRLPILETDAASPINILGKSKLITEKLVDFYDEGDKTFIILRIFNVYGPGQKDNFLIPTILNQLNKSDEITLGDTEAKRDYTYITDVIDAMVLAIEKDAPNNFSTFNVCSQKGTSAGEIVSIIGSLTKKDIKINVDKQRFRNDEESIEYGSFEKIKKELGWEPKNSLMEGLKKTLEVWRF